MNNIRHAEKDASSKTPRQNIFDSGIVVFAGINLEKNAFKKMRLDKA